VLWSTGAHFAALLCNASLGNVPSPFNHSTIPAAIAYPLAINPLTKTPQPTTRAQRKTPHLPSTLGLTANISTAAYHNNEEPRPLSLHLVRTSLLPSSSATSTLAHAATASCYPSPPPHAHQHGHSQPREYVWQAL